MCVYVCPNARDVWCFSSVDRNPSAASFGVVVWFLHALVCVCAGTCVKRWPLASRNNTLLRDAGRWNVNHASIQTLMTELCAVQRCFWHDTLPYPSLSVRCLSSGRICNGSLARRLPATVLDSSRLGSDWTISKRAICILQISTMISTHDELSAQSLFVVLYHRGVQ